MIQPMIEPQDILQALVILIPQAGIVWLGYRKLHKTMNSRLDELVAATKQLAFKEGQEQERSDAKAREVE